MKIPLSDSLTPSRKSHVFMHWQDGDLVVHQINDESVSKLNITAAFIWQHCDGNTSLAKIAAAIQKEHRSDDESLREDVSETIKALFYKGLVSLSKANVQPLIRVRFTGFPASFDVHDNFFLNLLAAWIDILVVEDGEQADIVIASNTNGSPAASVSVSPVRILVDATGDADASDYDLVFTTSNLSTDVDPPSVVIPADYLKDSAATIDPEGRQILQDLFSRDVTSPATPQQDTLQKDRVKKQKKLTIGMATYDDYDGVYFSVQAIRMFHPEIADEIEILVIDNNPDGPCGKDLKGLGAAIQGYRYIPNNEIKGTGVRDFVFQEAQTEYVLCIDCHVFIVPGAIRKLIDYFDTNPETPDLLQGPLVYDNLNNISTHFEPVWSNGMMGVWSTDDRGREPDGEPFDIPIQGMGLAACRKSSWPGYNKRFKGFCVEEGYIHQKFRNAGARTLCLPFLRWLHRFARPMGVPYENVWEDRIRNYLIAFEEVGLDKTEVIEHFSELINPEVVQKVTGQLEDEERELHYVQMREELPFVSCYCATYGRPQLLEEAIESFIRQDYQGRKELVILNDFSQQELVYDHPEVKIINSSERILPLGRKFNETVRLCQGDILLVWEDDDVYLPWRISYSVRHMKNGLFHTSQGYYEEQSGGALTTSRNMFHCNLAVSRERFWDVGGYPEDQDRGNVDVDIFKKLDVKSEDIPQSDVFYIYRWSGTNSYHGSWGVNESSTISEFAEQYVESQIESGDCPTGRIALQPQWRNDWLKSVKNINGS